MKYFLKVLFDELCNKVGDCSDWSDESDHLCRGGTHTYALSALAFIVFYLLLGCTTYAIIFLLWRKNEGAQENVEERNGTGQFLSNLREIHYLMSKSALTELDRDALRSIYHKSKEEDTLTNLLFSLKYTEERARHSRNLLLDTIYRIELGVSNGNVSKALTEIRSGCHDSVLYGWFVRVIDRGFIFNLTDLIKHELARLYAQLGQKIAFFKPKEDSPVTRQIKLGLSFLVAAGKITIFYLDVFKDLGLFFIIHHISDEILQHNFDSVGGLNLDWLKSGLLLACLGSQALIFASGIFKFRNKSQVYSIGKSHSKAVRILARIFPMHFAAFELTNLKHQEALTEKDLQEKCSKVASEESSEAEKLSLSRDLELAIEKLMHIRKKMRVVHRNHNRIQLIETVFERMPQAVLQGSVLLASRKYARLEFLLKTQLKQAFGLTIQQAFTLVLIAGLLGAINNLSQFKTEHRYPLRPSLLGKGLLLLSAASLVLPKVALLGTYLGQAPYLYLGTIILEFILGLAFQRLVLARKENLLSLESLSYAACPFMIRGVTDLTPHKTTERWRTLILRPAAVPATLILSVLTVLAIYLPICLVLRFKIYQVYDLGPLSEVGFASYMFAIGLGAHLLFSALYYGLGHNWKLAIKS